MDIVELLRKKVSALQPGPYSPGLRAVLLHVETAFKHLARGQATADDTAFTDAIYRTNQAFEGSIKEAYRVLAGRDPAHKKPAQIEDYLEREKIFRPRVLAQFTNYRREWRNPSAHDYQLDFDESEAFLAIVAVTAFAVLLIDQIDERAAFNRAIAKAESAPASPPRPMDSMTSDLLTITSEALKFYVENLAGDTTPHSEAQVTGSVHGFLTSAFPNFQVMTESSSRMTADTPMWRPDLLVVRGNDAVVIEVRRRLPYSGHEHAVDRLMEFMGRGPWQMAVLLFLPTDPDSEMDVIRVAGEDTRVHVLIPKLPNKKS
jgi:hypothetical protein